VGVFLTVLFGYFKSVTAPTRWEVWNSKNIFLAFEKDSGSEFLRPEALLMKRMTDKRSDKNYRLVGELKSNMYIRYPATEYLYPIRITENAPLVFSKKSEAVPLVKECRLIDELEGIALHECPNL